jgi:hypothetical protein
MYVSGNNIIRFPVQPVTPARAEREEQDATNVVGFPVPGVNEIAAMEMQERGQVFAAHRIVSRVADQLESVAAL